MDVPLKPLTVLIGQNDSGKSSFLAAIKFLANGTPPEQFDFRDADANGAIRVRADIQGVPHLEKLNETYLSSPPASLAKIQPLESYVLPSAGVPMESQGTPGYLATPGESGQQVAAILDVFLRSDRRRFDQIEAVIRDHLPGVDSLGIETPKADRRRVDLVFRSGLRMPADRASTGARLMIFFITLAYHPDPPKLILLEEPENGVHPKRLQQIMGLLREITQGKHGKHASQIIMTTHSPYLLDSVDATTDQVIVFRRTEKGDRTAEAVDTERLRGFLDEFMLGEVWFNQGEEGLIKKIG